MLDAAETVLGCFGFDRTVYGNKKNTGARMGGGYKIFRLVRSLFEP